MKVDGTVVTETGLLQFINWSQNNGLLPKTTLHWKCSISVWEFGKYGFSLVVI